MMMQQNVLLVVFGIIFSAPAAAGIGIGFGQPLEERVTGDYGPEYYREWQRRERQASQRRAVRCRTEGKARNVTRCGRRR